MLKHRRRHIPRISSLHVSSNHTHMLPPIVFNPSCLALALLHSSLHYFPAMYLSPELMRLMVVSHLEYAMNFTREPYPQPFAPHHLGYWPLANLPYTKQENMPLEETSWNLLIIALIAQAQGGDLEWIAPYWPVIQTWYVPLAAAKS